MSEVKKIATRESYGKALVELGAEHSNLVVLDADPAQCPRLSRSGAYHPVRTLHTARRRTLVQLLTGSTQEGPVMRRLLPELRPGDPVLIGMLGADGQSLASRYGGAEPCPEYLVRPDGGIMPLTAY